MYAIFMIISYISLQMKGADLYPWLVKMYKMKAQVLHADCGGDFLPLGLCSKCKVSPTPPTTEIYQS